MFRTTAIALVALPVSALLAAPMIAFDTLTFNCGTIIEGKTDKLLASFTVKNIGDQDLRLTNVRPGCGCTVVKFDSLIKPGSVARIEAQVNIKNAHSGPLSKGITVTSNAGNLASVQLTIQATIRGIIDVSTNYLSFDASQTDTAQVVYLSSQKADLKVRGIAFRASQNPSAAWDSNRPLAIKYTWTPTDSIRSDGYKVYKLEMFTPAIDSTGPGEVVVETNHPEKARLSLRGMIFKGRE
jgi:hypothetical protein